MQTQAYKHKTHEKNTFYSPSLGTPASPCTPPPRLYPSACHGSRPFNIIYQTKKKKTHFQKKDM